MSPLFKLVPALLLATACTTAVPLNHAVAEPPLVFPNLADFTPVDATTYEITEPWGNVAYFTTDSGIFCSMSAYVACGGGIGGVPNLSATASQCLTVRASDDSPNTYRFNVRDSPCSPRKDWKRLQAGTKISVGLHSPDEFTCAAGDAGLLACIDKQQHGFVLHPSHSWTF